MAKSLPETHQINVSFSDEEELSRPEISLKKCTSFDENDSNLETAYFQAINLSKNQTNKDIPHITNLNSNNNVICTQYSSPRKDNNESSQQVSLSPTSENTSPLLLMHQRSFLSNIGIDSIKTKGKDLSDNKSKVKSKDKPENLHEGPGQWLSKKSKKVTPEPSSNHSEINYFKNLIEIYKNFLDQGQGQIHYSGRYFCLLN